MAVTAKFIREVLIDANVRGKIYSIAHDGSGTTFSIYPGKGYVNPIGEYTCFTTTTTAGEYGFTVVAGTSTYLNRLLFLQ